MNYVHKLIMAIICTHIINNIYLFFDGSGLLNPTRIVLLFGFVVVVVVVVDVVVVVVVVVAVVDNFNSFWSRSSHISAICSQLRPSLCLYFTVPSILLELDIGCCSISSESEFSESFLVDSWLIDCLGVEVSLVMVSDPVMFENGIL